MNTDKTLEFIIKAVDNTKEAFNSVAENTEKLKVSFNTVAIGAGIMGTAILGALSYTVVKASEAQTALAEFNVQVNNIKGTTPEMKEALIAAAEAGAKLGFNVEDSTKAISNAYTVTKNTTDAIKLYTAAQDLHAAKGIDLVSAQKMVDLAYEGNGKALKEYGIIIDKHADKMTAIDQLEGVIGGAAEARSKTFAGQMEVIKSTTEELSVKIGNVLLPILVDMASKIESIINKITPWIESHQKLVTTVVEVVAVIGTALVSFSLVVGAFNAISSVITATQVILKLFSVQAAIEWVVAFWPIALIVVAVVALGLLIYTFRDQIMNALRAIGGFFVEVWNTIKQYFVDYITFEFNIIIGIVTVVGNVFSSVFNGIKTVIKDVVDAIVGWFTGLITAIDNIINKVEQMLSSIAKVGTGIWNSVTGAVSSAVSTITGKRAEGGPVDTSGTYLVGENGPELFTPSTNGTIIPNGKGTGIGAGGISITINGGSFVGGSAQQIAVQLGDLIAKRLQFSQKVQ